MSASWTFTNTVVTGAAPIAISDSLSIVSEMDVSVHNRVLRKTYSIAGGGTQVVDLASFTDDFNAGAAVVLTKAKGVVITGTQAFTVGPNNAANPLQWFWGGSTQTLVFAANEGFAALNTVTFTTGSKLLITNTSGSAGTFPVTILGGT